MRRRHTCDIVVVGAGPAGLSAAQAAAEKGLDVVVVDANSRPGGQYYMQPLAAGSAFARSTQVMRGKTEVRNATAAGVTMLLATEVWGAFPGFVFHAQDPDGAVCIESKAVIVATGAHDRVQAFPGWTLPGVMTPGAGQRLAKTSGVPPGRRTVLAGSGPFLLPVAGTVLKAGGTLVEVVEARSSLLPTLPLIAVHPDKWLETLRLVFPILAARTRLRFGEVVVAASGEERVREVELAPLDAGGQPDLARRRVVSDIDALLVGFGFQPQIELTAVLGCRHHFDEEAGGWCCTVMRDCGATDICGVFAAGEVCGVGGAVPAALSGRIAGLAAAGQILDEETALERRSLVRRLQRARRFAGGLNRRFMPPSGVAEILSDETIICRCEDVTAGEIRKEIAGGMDTIHGVKLWTRAGMGPCQARFCGWSLARLVAEETGKTMGEIGFSRPRIPLRPVPLNVVRDSIL
ncbi:MAG: NAD(P)/FAD-dependent oxidoreductase [bacterium]|nr:NAD(P)/FAD-dependent oxidoreductase [bacterium]